MKLLAIDTSESGCTAALSIDGDTKEKFELAPRAHTDLILPMIDELMADAGLKPADLDCLAYGRGPGSFTGIRVGAGVIQGIAIAVDIPVVAVSTLQALAQGMYRTHGAKKVLTAFDARMQEVYWGVYAMDEKQLMRVASDECVVAPANVPDVEGDQWFAAGSAWPEYSELSDRFVSQISGRDDNALVHAADVATLALDDYVNGLAVAAEFALPVYLRDNVAKKKAEQRA